MIFIQHMPVTMIQLRPIFPDEKSQEILELMVKYREAYMYENMEQLRFELIVRINTIDAAHDLLKSKAKFATFAGSYCNDEYWTLNRKGAFILKKGILPSDAIKDIFENGDKYAFECATAIVIIFYKAVLDSIGKNAFNYLFSNIVLYDWHYDEDLGITTKSGNDFLPLGIAYILKTLNLTLKRHNGVEKTPFFSEKICIMVTALEFELLKELSKHLINIEKKTQQKRHT